MVKNKKTVWIARDENKELFIYTNKPKLDNTRRHYECTFTYSAHYSDVFELPEELYPSLKFQDGPKELVIK